MTSDDDDRSTTVTIQSLLDERQLLQHNSRNRPTGTGRWTGNFRGRRRGQGTDFDDLRHYSAGDEIRHVDWKASARTNSLHTRLYREEREHRITLVTDLRRTLFTGTRELRSARACHLTARLLWQAVEGGSRTRVVVVMDTGLAVSNGGTGHQAAIDACALLARCFQQVSSLRATTAEPPLGAANALPDAVLDSESTLAQVADWLTERRQFHGSIVWLSAFDQLGIGFDGAMLALSQASRQIAIYIDDEMLELGLPTGHYGYRSGASTQRKSLRIVIGRNQATRLRKHLQEQKRRRVARFADLSIPLLTSGTGSSAIVTTMRQTGHLP